MKVKCHILQKRSGNEAVDGALEGAHHQGFGLVISAVRVLFKPY
jgi:hypothetical protein